MTTPTLGGWLVHVMRQADGALSLEEALHIIMDSTKEYFPCQSVAVVVVDEDTNELRIKISRQISYSFAKEFRRHGPSPTAEKVVLEQQPRIFNHLDPKSERYAELKMEHDFTSVLLAPVVRNQKGVGYIFCDRRESDPFTDADLLHLQVIGYLIGHFSDKFELMRESKSLAQTDDASGALKYKAFVPAFATELQRAAAHGYELTLAIMAVGAFRAYIETYGIEAAHGLLAETVQVVKRQLRDMDLLARFAADEFVLCLSGMTEPEAARKLAEVREVVARDVIGRGEPPAKLTIGAVCLRGQKDMKRRVQDILAAAGANLVRAKEYSSENIVIGAMA